MNYLSLNKRGQSTLEYLIVWTALITAVLFAANTYLRPAVESTVEKLSLKISKEVQRLVDNLGCYRQDIL